MTTITEINRKVLEKDKKDKCFAFAKQKLQTNLSMYCSYQSIFYNISMFQLHNSFLMQTFQCSLSDRDPCKPIRKRLPT